MIYVVFNTARMIDGEYVYIMAEKAFTNKSKAEDFWRSQVRVTRQEVNGVMCECERAIHEVNLEE